MICLAGVREQALESQPRQRGDLLDNGERLARVRIDAAAMKSDVDLDQDVDAPARARHRLGPLLRHGGMIDDERKSCAIEQSDHAIGVRWVDRIGEADVLYSRSCEHFCFAE